MAITYVGSASTPADGGSHGGETVTINPPGGAAAGDLVLVIFYQVWDSGITVSIDVSGGQAWTAETQISQNFRTVRLFWCRFNGTWSAVPRFRTNSVDAETTGVMHVFRPSSAENEWAVDVAMAYDNFLAPSSSPYLVTIPGIVTQRDGAMAIAIWVSKDDNQWVLQTAGWSVAGSNQYRNTYGLDTSSATAYKIMTTAGATGDVVNRQNTNGPDAGIYITIAFREMAQLQGDFASSAGASGDIDALDMKPEAESSAGASGSIDAILLVGDMSAAAGALGEVDAAGEYLRGQVESAGVSGSFSVFGEYPKEVSEVAGASGLFDALSFGAILAAYGHSERRYFCILTGAEDELPDLALPIATLQARLRQGTPNWLAVTVPGKDLAAGIAARLNGQIVVSMAIVHRGTEIIREEIARVDLESIRTDEGGRSNTITLSGHRTVTYHPQLCFLRGVTYRARLNTGQLSFRCAEPDLYLRPGDTCRYEADSFVAGLVQYVVSPRSQSMTVTEAD